MDKNEKMELMKRIKAILKEYGTTRPGGWSFTSRWDITPRCDFEDDELYVDDDLDKPDVNKAERVMKQAEEALSKLDAIREDTFLEWGEPDKDLLDDYWDTVELIESDIDEILLVLNSDKFGGGEESIDHIIRAIERFDFRTLPSIWHGQAFARGLITHGAIRSEVIQALAESQRVEAPEVEASILALTARAAKAGTLEDYEEEIATLCFVLSEKGLNKSLPGLKKISKRGNDTSTVCSCRAILDLEGVDPDDDEHPCAKKARNVVAEAKAEEEFWYEGAMLEDEDKAGMRETHHKACEHALLLSNTLYCPGDIRVEKGIALACSMCGREIDFGDFDGKKERGGFAKSGLCKRCLDMSQTGEVELGFNEFEKYLGSSPEGSLVKIVERENIQRASNGTNAKVIDVEISTLDATLRVRVSTNAYVGVAHPRQGKEYLEQLRLKAGNTIEIFKVRFENMGASVEL